MSDYELPQGLPEDTPVIGVNSEGFKEHVAVIALFEKERIISITREYLKVLERQILSKIEAIKYKIEDLEGELEALRRVKVIWDRESSEG